MLSDLDEEFKDYKEEEDGEDEFASWEHPLFFGVVMFVSAFPDHEDGVEAEEDGAADASCVAEGFEEEFGVDESDDGGREKD